VAYYDAVKNFRVVTRRLVLGLKIHEHGGVRPGRVGLWSIRQLAAGRRTLPPLERCLACEAVAERSDIAGNCLVAHLRSTSFEALDPYYRRAMFIEHRRSKRTCRAIFP
jgi:hypothetical protein